MTRLVPGTTAYVNAHQEVRKVRGVPGPCVECGADEKPRQWANISGYYLGPDDYQAMCVPCHVSMDQRAAHDRREDHPWATRDGIRCAVCRARSSAAEYRRIQSDQARRDHRRSLNRVAVRRYRERKNAQ